MPLSLSRTLFRFLAATAVINDPERADRQADGKAQRRALHQLAENSPSSTPATNSMENTADRHLRSLAAVQRQIFDAGIATGEEDLVGDHRARPRKGE